MIDIKAIKAAAEAANKHDELSLDQLVEYLNAVPTEAVIALCDEIERLRTDAARLDWLEHNLFHRENIDWVTKNPSTTQNMWVTFAPIGVQGSARRIIDAAMEAMK